MRFTWDTHKAKANLRQHGVSFDEASTAFNDMDARVEFDIDHSDAEERFLLLGRSNKDRPLIVCFCYRGEDVIRIISARKATHRMRISYQRW